jgi:hypothetical protein
MLVSPLSNATYQAMPSASKPDPALLEQDAQNEKELRKAFDDFVGQTFYGQMLSAMRETVGKPAYMYGGRAEEVFQKQLDQLMAEKLSDATASTFTGPMYELFSLPRVA